MLAGLILVTIYNFDYLDRGWLGDPGAVRYGEAAHPGPDGDRHEAQRGGCWESFGCVRYRRPNRDGFQHALMDIGDSAGSDVDVAPFALSVETVNCTAWGSAMRRLRCTRAELVLLQEHHLPQSRIADASAWALRHGWHSLFSPAVEGTGGGWRGGVAVLARPHIGLGAPAAGPIEVVPARVLAASVEPPGFRRTTVLSVYLEDGKGTSAANLRHMQEIGRCVQSQGEHVPCLVGGDWQAAPESVAATGLATQAGMTIVATGHPRGTCRSTRAATELDYFLLTNDLVLGLDRIETVEGAGTRPHVPVRLTFRPRLTSIRALHVRAPPQLPTQRMIGPLRKPPDWSDLRARARALTVRAADVSDRCGSDFENDFAALFSSWADRAEEEIVEATGAAFYGEVKKLGLRGKAPLLVWRSIVAERPPPSNGAEQEAWRARSANAVELQRALHHLLAAATIGQGDRRLPHDVDDAVDAHDDAPFQRPDGLSHHGDYDDAMEHVDIAMNIMHDIWDLVKDAPIMDCELGEPERVDVRLRELIMAADGVIAGLRSAICDDDTHGAACRLDQVTNLLDLMTDIRKVVNLGIAAATDRAKAADIAEWRKWVCHNIDRGAKNAHRYLALPEEWRPTELATVDGTVTSCPMKLLEAYRHKYDRLWNQRHRDERAAAARAGGSGERGGGDDARSADWRPWHDATDRSSLPRVTPSEIRAAALSFRDGTLVAYDGVAMRQYALLSDEALEVLSDVIVVVERLGKLPEQLRFTVMPMIPKARGGHRAIASLVSLYRLWSRLRRDESRRWEAANDRPYLAAGKGRGPQDAVWRQAAKAEAAVGTRKLAATVLWDMSSFFETIRRVPLWHRAKRLGFPLTLLRVALRAYEAPRALAISGALARPLCADDGVLPGCGFAMALTKVFVIEALDRVVAQLHTVPPTVRQWQPRRDRAPQQRHDPPRPPASADPAGLQRPPSTSSGDVDSGQFGDDDSSVDLYVDDVAATAVGNSVGEVTGRMTEIVEVLRDTIVNVLGCRIEVEKASIVASSAKLAAVLKGKFGELAGGTAAPHTAAVNLGIDYAPGRPRTAHAASGKRRRRMHRLRAKARRLARIRSLAGRRAIRIYTAGPMAEAVYGAAVNGLSGTEVQTLRRTAASAFSPRARGRSLSTVLLMAGAPTWRGEVEVVMQYARQVWAATLLGAARPHGGELTLSQLSRIWNDVTSGGLVPLPGRSAWAQVRGPIGALHLTLHRLQWSMKGPFTLQDESGEEILLTRTPPGLLGQMLKRAVVRTLELKVAAVHAVGDSRFSGRRAAVDHVVAQLARDRTLSAADRAAYRSVACGALMTYSRAARNGYLVHDTCPLCGQRGDTVRHRIWHCQHPAAVAARNAVAPAWLREEEERRDATDSFWEHGFIPHPADEWPKPASDPVAHVQYGQGGLPRPSDGDGTHEHPAICGRVFGDGSCSTNVFPELRRAGTALIQTRDDGARGWVLQCPVPAPLPQTPQAAEYAVLALANRFAHPTAATDIASDCANVVRAYNGPAREAVAHRRPYGGIMREVLGDEAWRRRTTVRKVKAHLNPDAVADPTERRDAEDNGAVDVAAKEAVTMHPQPTPSQVTDLEAALKRSRLVVRTIAKVTQVFPPMPADRMRRPPRARDGARVSIDGAHDWAFTAGFWRCGRCLKLSTRPEVTQAMACEPCAGPKASLAADAITDRGHVLAATPPPMQVLFCIRCGAFSTRRAYGLGARCAGAPKPSGKQALARIRRGLQPWEVRTAGGRQRGTLGQALAWDAERRTFVAAGPARSRRRKGQPAVDAPEMERTRARPRPAAQVLENDEGNPLLSMPLDTEPPVKMLRTDPRDGSRSGDVEPRDEDVPMQSEQHGGGGSLEGRALPRHALHRADQRAGLLHRHRPDGARAEGGPIGGRHRQLLNVDPRPRVGASEGVAQRLGGPPETGSAAGSAGRCPGDGPPCPNVSARNRIGYIDGSVGDLGIDCDTSSYPHSPSARLRRPRSPLHERPRDRDGDQGACGSGQPGDDHDGPAHGHRSGGDGDERSSCWHLPWGGHPAWLYLPHLGAGGGVDCILAARRAKRRREDESTATGADRAARAPRTVGGGSVPSQEADAVSDAGTSSTRARKDAVSQPPGMECVTSGNDDAERQPIRGQHPLLGPRSAAEEAARARLSARLAARNAPLQTSLNLHAERVALKRLRDGPSAGEDAASRLAALRARVAARAAAARLGPAAAGGDHNVEDAAARVATPARRGDPEADDGRQLRD